MSSARYGGNLKAMSQSPLLVLQGRIQDLKLGVAQTDWKLEIWKRGGGGGGGGGDLRYDYIFLKCNIYLKYYIFIYFKNDFYYYILYILSPLTRAILW